MKIFKRILAVALVVVSVMAVAAPALAAYRPWQDRWNAHTIFPDTFPASGTELNQQIRNLQNDLNTLRFKYTAFCTPGSSYYYAQLTADGKYGTNTTNAVKCIQRYFNLDADGACGVNTKNRIWNALGYQPVADEKANG